MKHIHLEFTDEVFEELKIKKIRLGAKNDTSYSWERYFMILTKIKK